MVSFQRNFIRYSHRIVHVQFNIINYCVCNIHVYVLVCNFRDSDEEQVGVTKIRGLRGLGKYVLLYMYIPQNNHESDLNSKCNSKCFELACTCTCTMYMLNKLHCTCTMYYMYLS